MKRETKKPLDEQRRIIAYLGDLQAKVNALRESAPFRPALHKQGETPPPAGGTPSGVLREGRRGFFSALIPSYLIKRLKVNYEDPKGLSRKPSSRQAGESGLRERETVKETLRVSDEDVPPEDDVTVPNARGSVRVVTEYFR